MNDAPSNALSLAVGLAGLASLAVLFRLFQKHIDGRPLLEYEPRRPAPWNALGPLLMIAPLALALGANLFGERQPDPNVEALTSAASVPPGAVAAPPAAWFASSMTGGVAIELGRRLAQPPISAGPLWLQSAPTLLLALSCYVLLAIVFGATRRDLGLPASWRQLRSDVAIGATACIASLAPIYTVMYVLSMAFEPQEGHPLIEELIDNHSLSMMAAAAFAATVVAPLYEETAFRLVFQGWLERIQMLLQPVAASPSSTLEAPLELESSHPSSTTGYYASPPGWAPVIISSLVFGLAHFGHGVAPAPLVLLGVVLGYLYRQTHRIVPCIACHVLFNAFTFMMLALEFAAGE